MVHKNLITNSFSFTYKICSQFMLIRPVYKRVCTVCTHARPRACSLSHSTRATRRGNLFLFSQILNSNKSSSASSFSCCRLEFVTMPLPSPHRHFNSIWMFSLFRRRQQICCMDVHAVAYICVHVVLTPPRHPHAGPRQWTCDTTLDTHQTHTPVELIKL